MAWVFEVSNGVIACASYNCDYLGQTSGRAATVIPTNPKRFGEVGELDELETFVGSKKTKSGARSAVNHFTQGILGWVLGDHSAATFEPLWQIVGAWQCYFYITDGWSVYPGFIPAGDQIVSKTYMTRVEGENTRLRHYERSSAPQDSLLFAHPKKCLGTRVRLLLHYLKFWDVPVPS